MAEIEPDVTSEADALREENAVLRERVAQLEQELAALREELGDPAHDEGK